MRERIGLTLLMVRDIRGDNMVTREEHVSVESANRGESNIHTVSRVATDGTTAFRRTLR